MTEEDWTRVLAVFDTPACGGKTGRRPKLTVHQRREAIMAPKRLRRLPAVTI
jgi:hypothetical protein